MTKLDDLARVVRLAALVEDRDRGDQAALRRVARWIDKSWNSRVVTNHRDTDSRLLELVEDTAS